MQGILKILTIVRLYFKMIAAGILLGKISRYLTKKLLLRRVTIRDHFMLILKL